MRRCSYNVFRKLSRNNRFFSTSTSSTIKKSKLDSLDTTDNEQLKRSVEKLKKVCSKQLDKVGQQVNGINNKTLEKVLTEAEKTKKNFSSYG